MEAYHVANDKAGLRAVWEARGVLRRVKGDVQGAGQALHEALGLYKEIGPVVNQGKQPCPPMVIDGGQASRGLTPTCAWALCVVLAEESQHESGVRKLMNLWGLGGHPHSE